MGQKILWLTLFIIKLNWRTTMLVLSRKIGEKVIIGNRVLTLMVVSYDDERRQVKLGFEADKSISINREEIFLKIIEEFRLEENPGEHVWTLPEK